jgi:hypothetical protein
MCYLFGAIDQLPVFGGGGGPATWLSHWHGELEMQKAAAGCH